MSVECFPGLSALSQELTGLTKLDENLTTVSTKKNKSAADFTVVSQFDKNRVAPAPSPVFFSCHTRGRLCHMTNVNLKLRHYRFTQMNADQGH